MTVDANDVIAWVAAFVALWWVIDWFTMRQEGEALPLRRAPLRVLADVARKLWRNKTLLAVLLALWLIGAAVLAVQSTITRIGHVGPVPDTRPMFTRTLGLMDTVPELLARELPEALPRLQEVPPGAWGALLLSVLLIAAFVRIALAPPESIGEETVRRLWWPAGVLLAGLALYLVMFAIGNRTMGGPGIEPPTSRAGSVLLMIAGFAVLPALLAPMFGLLWRLVLEIARDGVWSFASSIRALAESWLPITLVLLIANGLKVISAEVQPGVRGTYYVYLAVLVLLALVPFAVVDQQAGFIAALKRSWRLFRQKPIDVIAFGLRFTLLFAVLGGLVALLEPRPMAEWAAWWAPLLQLVRYGIVLLQVAVLAGLYVHLGELLAADEACASCPSTQPAGAGDGNG